MGEGAGPGVGRHHVEGGPGQRADRVEAEVAPKFEPDLVADPVQDRRLEAGTLDGRAQALAALARLARRLAEGELVAIDVVDDSGRLDLGGWIDHAADRPLGPDGVPLAVPGIDAGEADALERAIEAVKVPPGHAVLAGHDRGLRAEQRRHAVGHLPGLMGLQRDHHEVLRADVLGIVGGRRVDRVLLAPVDQGQAAFADRCEMGAPGDQRDLGPLSPRQRGAKIAADGAGAIDANLHVQTPPVSPTATRAA